MAANDITGTMGLDNTAFEKALDSAAAKVDRSVSRMKATTKDGFFDLKGPMRVENQLGAMVKGLATAEDAVGGVVIALDRLENVFKSSLGASIAVAGIVTLITSVKKANEEFAKLQADGVKAAQDIGKAIAGGDFTGALEKAQARVESLQLELNKLGNVDSGGKKLSIGDRLFGPSWEQKLEETMEQLERAKEQAADAATKKMEAKRDKENADILKAEDELQGKILAEDLKTIDERNQAEDKAAEDAKANRIKSEAESAQAIASIHLARLQTFWKEVTDMATKARAEMDANEKAHVQMRADHALNVARDNWQKLEDMAAAARNLADAKEAKAQQDRGDALANEMLPPGERKLERDTKRAEARAEDNAIKRMAQKEQDAASRDMTGKKMTDKERDARADEMRKARAEDKKPQAEKDMDRAAKDFKDKAAEAAKADKDGAVKDIKAVNLIVDVFKNAL